MLKEHSLAWIQIWHQTLTKDILSSEDKIPFKQIKLNRFTCTKALPVMFGNTKGGPLFTYHENAMKLNFYPLEVEICNSKAKELHH